MGLIVAAFLAAVQAVGSAMALCIAFAYLSWSGMIDQKFLVSLSTVAKNLLIPCIVFDSIAGHMTLDFVLREWSLVVLGVVFLITGSPGLPCALHCPPCPTLGGPETGGRVTA